jgi:hypothetical protein
MFMIAVGVGTGVGANAVLSRNIGALVLFEKDDLLT